MKKEKKKREIFRKNSSSNTTCYKRNEKRLISAFDDRKKTIDIVITEIGGTIQGDIESLSFIEAIRQFGVERPDEDVLYIHVTLVPTVMGSTN